MQTADYIDIDERARLERAVLGANQSLDFQHWLNQDRVCCSEVVPEG